MKIYHEVRNGPIVPVSIEIENEKEVEFLLDQLRPKGEWIGDTDFDNTCKCSKCKMTFDTDRLKMVMCDGKYELPPFCPNCGADMRKGGAE